MKVTWHNHPLIRHLAPKNFLHYNGAAGMFTQPRQCIALLETRVYWKGYILTGPALRVRAFRHVPSAANTVCKAGHCDLWSKSST